MITTILIVVCTLLAILLVFYTARRGASDIRSIADLDSVMQPIDMESLYNLLDERQRDYVRERVSPSDFASYERERSRVLIEYVGRIAHNSAVLIGLAHRLVPAGEVAQVESFRQEILAQAFRMRSQALLALAMLHVKVLLPSLDLALVPLAARYDASRQLVAAMQMAMARPGVSAA